LTRLAGWRNIDAMKALTILVTAVLAGRCLSAEGVAEAWTKVAEVDRVLVGDYEGEWSDAPAGQYFDINRPIAAQVLNLREGQYGIRMFQEHDRRADPYFEGQGVLEGGVIRFGSGEVEGTVSKDGMSGTFRLPEGQKARFSLGRKVRSSPTLGAPAPAGAVVLFDGRNFDAWTHKDGEKVTWALPGNGAMEVASNEERMKKRLPGDIRTKQSFGDFRLHLEFRYPVDPGKAGQKRGNSGVFLQDTYEVQVLNSFGLAGNWNECGALYKTAPPKVNAARPPMEWQTYDIEYRASVWKDGRKISPPRVTVRLNGVLIHNGEEIPHATSHAFKLRGEEPEGPQPLRLQDHGDPIQYRNIWIVPGQ
jgi:hypothetical protein